MKKGILDESQKERDLELSKLTGISLNEIGKIKLFDCNGKLDIANLVISKNNYESIKPCKLEDLYKHTKLENLKIVMYTSVNKRGKELIKILKQTENKVCLDYGSGVGTHAIALLENNNKVEILDVAGETLDFAKKRISLRGFNVKVWTTKDVLPDNYFDLVICTNVLEHVVSPLKSLKQIHKSLKKNGTLHLLVSKSINPSKKHFKFSIDEWKTKGMKFVNENFLNKEKYLYIKK